MSLLLISALAVSGPVQSACSWDRPGDNPFMGDVVAAVDRYQDIPPDVRVRLKQRIAARRYDELAIIKRDSIAGAYQYADLRDMHFGKGSVCRTVTRTRWPEKLEERGLVYCEDKHCLIVPTVCRNVSRVTRLERRQAQLEPLPADRGPRMDIPFAAVPEPVELQFEAPAAGASPSFASVVQDVPTVPVHAITPAGKPETAPMPSFEPRDGSWAGFAGLVVRTALPIFWIDATPRSVLQTPPVLDSNLQPVPGIAPPPNPSPVPTTTSSVPPIVVSLPTVPPLSEPGVPGPIAPVPGVTPAMPLSANPPSPPVPNLPSDPGQPVEPSGPGIPGIPPAQGPTHNGPAATDPGLSSQQNLAPAALVPEPATLLLMAMGLALVGWMSRRSTPQAGRSTGCCV